MFEFYEIGYITKQECDEISTDTINMQNSDSDCSRAAVREISPIQQSTTKRLTLKRVINRWDTPPYTKLKAVDVTNDGNCLFHSVSMILNGKEDTNMNLRNELYAYLTDTPIEKTIYTLQTYSNIWKTGHSTGVRTRVRS